MEFKIEEIGQHGILFVCTGNICRSPTAEGVLLHLAKKARISGWIEVDSAGLIDFHEGESPDKRSQEAALARGIDLSHIRARKIVAEDFKKFDNIFALDQSHKDALLELAPEEDRNRIMLLMDFAPNIDAKDVPDPYYGGPEDFERALDLIEIATAGIVDQLCNIFPAERGSTTSPAHD